MLSYGCAALCCKPDSQLCHRLQHVPHRNSGCDSHWVTQLVTPRVNVKVNFTLEQATKARGGRLMYSSTLSFISALYGGVVNATLRPLLPPGNTRYPLYRRLGGPQSRFGLVRWTFLLLKVRTICCLETSGTDYPVTRRYVPEECNPHLNCCKNLKTCNNLRFRSTVSKNEFGQTKI
jgi:hypothetical protein